MKLKISLFVLALFIAFIIGLTKGREQCQNDLYRAQAEFANLNYQVKQCQLLYRGQ